jgi:hypothetical protein
LPMKRAKVTLTRHLAPLTKGNSLAYPLILPWESQYHRSAQELPGRRLW